VQPIPWSDLLEAVRDFRRAWPQLVLTDLLSRMLATLILIVSTGLLLRLFLIRTADGVLADVEIAEFLLHPIGLLALVVVGAVSLGMLFAETGVLMVVGFGAVENRRITWLDSLGYVARHTTQLVRLAGEVVARGLLIATPFLAGVGGIYLLFLRRFDINYYLAYNPPEFRRAVALASVLVIALAIVGLRVFAGWILALPLVLFEGYGGKQALAASKRIVAGREWSIFLALVAWLAARALVSWLATVFISLVGDLLVPDVGGSLVLLAVGLGVTLLVAGLVNLGIVVLTTVVFALLLVRLYRSLGGPGRLEPAIAQRGSLGQRASRRIPGKAALGSALGALVLLVIALNIATTRLAADEQVAVIAHRGASAAAPENTMAAFERAIVDGADWIELDVQESADGVVVVAHDSDFMKLARLNLKVWSATAEDLHNLDVGSWFCPEFSDQRVSTLREVLERAKGEIGVVIELKYYGHDEKLESRVVQLVEETGMVSDVQIMSLSLSGLRKARALRPEWTYGLLNTASVGDLTKLKLDFLALNASAATRAMIQRAHSRGMKVYVWTVNDPVRMSVMISRGADGLITDEPALAREVLEYRDELGPIARLLVWIAGETGFLRVHEEASIAEDA